MSKLLHVLSGDSGKGVRGKVKKEMEIAMLKEKVGELYARNNELDRENRKLRIRNAELDVAYNGLKEILRKRGTCTP